MSFSCQWGKIKGVFIGMPMGKRILARNYCHANVCLLLYGRIQDT